jgi:nucleotide-binding universal stress UspA family protein
MEVINMFTKILLATDGSDGALRAAHAAADMAQRFGAEVTVINVFSLPMPIAPITGLPGVEFDPATVAEYTDKVQEAVERRTGKILEEAGIKYEVKREIGNPAVEITRIAEKERFDLIIMGSRGLSTFQSLLLGSVSDRVAHQAHCSMLIVK